MVLDLGVNYQLIMYLQGNLRKPIQVLRKNNINIKIGNPLIINKGKAEYETKF